MISAVGDHKETHTCMHTGTHVSTHRAPRSTGLSAAQACKGTHGSLVAPAPVNVFTFAPESEDSGPFVGVNARSGAQWMTRSERAEWQTGRSQWAEEGLCVWTAEGRAPRC